MRFENEIILAKYEFDEDEKKAIAKQLVELMNRVEATEGERKVSASHFKSAIDDLQTRIRNEKNKYRDGFEMRNMECEVKYNWADDVVEYRRTNDYKLVRARPMTPDERQLEFEFKKTEGGDDADI